MVKPTRRQILKLPAVAVVTPLGSFGTAAIAAPKILPSAAKEIIAKAAENILSRPLGEFLVPDVSVEQAIENIKTNQSDMQLRYHLHGMITSYAKKEALLEFISLFPDEILFTIFEQTAKFIHQYEPEQIDQCWDEKSMRGKLFRSLTKKSDISAHLLEARDLLNDALFDYKGNDKAITADDVKVRVINVGFPMVTLDSSRFQPPLHDWSDPIHVNWAVEQEFFNLFGFRLGKYVIAPDIQEKFSEFVGTEFCRWALWEKSDYLCPLMPYMSRSTVAPFTPEEIDSFVENLPVFQQRLNIAIGEDRDSYAPSGSCSLSTAAKDIMSDMSVLENFIQVQSVTTERIMPDGSVQTIIENFLEQAAGEIVKEQLASALPVQTEASLIEYKPEMPMANPVSASEKEKQPITPPSPI